MRYNLYRTWRCLQTNATIWKNWFIPIARSPTFQTLSITNAIAIVKAAADEHEQKYTIEADLRFPVEIKNACAQNDKALIELMDVLGSCLIQISKEYQINLEKQIAITVKCTELGPVGEHWDELTKYRVEANDLRQELSKYEALVKKVGQMAYNQAVTSLLSGIESAMDLLEVHYTKLERTVTRLADENYQCETKLLSASRDSILYSSK